MYVLLYLTDDASPAFLGVFRTPRQALEEGFEDVRVDQLSWKHLPTGHGALDFVADQTNKPLSILELEGPMVDVKHYLLLEYEWQL